MQLKQILLLCLVITLVSGGWWGRRRRRRKPSGGGSGPTVSGSLECPGGKCQGTLSVEKKWGDRTSLSGHVTCGGGGRCGGGVSFTHRFKRGISKTDKFQVRIGLDICDFESYDGNDNNRIEKEELVFLFGDDVLTDVLFEVLDTNGDDFISIDEFKREAPKHIATC